MAAAADCQSGTGVCWGKAARWGPNRNRKRTTPSMAASTSGRSSAMRPAVLAAGEGAFLYLLGPAIREYRRRGTAPLRLLTRDGPAAVEAVRTGEAHLGVAVAAAASDGVIVEPFTRRRCCW